MQGPAIVQLQHLHQVTELLHASVQTALGALCGPEGLVGDVGVELVVRPARGLEVLHGELLLVVRALASLVLERLLGL